MTGAQTINGTTTGLRADYRATCDMVDPGRNRLDAVYTFTLTEQRMVTLLLQGGTGNPEFDTSMYLRTTCTDSATEFACNDDNEGIDHHGSLIARLLNPGTYFLFVDGSEDMESGTTQSGAYRLVVAMGAPSRDLGVTFTQTMASCVAPPSGTEALTFSGSMTPTDDGQSRALGIGFNFRLLGTDFSFLAASVNGYVQLLTGNTVMPISGSTSARNAAIPNNAAPNAVVAAFWDDLILRSGVSRVETWQDGPVTNRIRHVRWTAMDRYEDFGGDFNITFELRLFESNQIEMQYCTLDGPRTSIARGESATVGIESGDGRTGFPILFNTRWPTAGTLFTLDQR